MERDVELWCTRPGFAACDGTDRSWDEVRAIPEDFLSAGGEEIGRVQSVGSEEAVHVGCRGVAWVTGVDDHDGAAGARQHQCCRQPGGASANDQDVIGEHVRSLLCPGEASQTCC